MSDKIKRALLEEAAKWEAKTYQEVRDELTDEGAIGYECGEGDTWYQTKVVVLEYNQEYIHLSISVDDGGFRSILLPRTTGVILYQDGREKEQKD